MNDGDFVGCIGCVYVDPVFACGACDMKKNRTVSRRRKAGGGLLDRLQDNFVVGVKKLRRQLGDVFAGIGLVTVIVLVAKALTAWLSGGG